VSTVVCTKGTIVHRESCPYFLRKFDTVNLKYLTTIAALLIHVFCEHLLVVCVYLLVILAGKDYSHFRQRL
jgi:hypothetical protein